MNAPVFALLSLESGKSYNPSFPLFLRTTKTPSPTVTANATSSLGKAPSPSRAQSSKRTFSEQMVGNTSHEAQPSAVMEVISASADSLEVMRNRPAREDPQEETEKFLEDSFNPDVQLNSLKSEWKGMFAGASSFNKKFEVLLFCPSWYTIFWIC